MTVHAIRLQSDDVEDRDALGRATREGMETEVNAASGGDGEPRDAEVACAAYSANPTSELLSAFVTSLADHRDLPAGASGVAAVEAAYPAAASESQFQALMAYVESRGQEGHRRGA